MTDIPTVFVVDDDQEARESVEALVKSLNGRCELFASGEDFLEAYDPARLGCLVTDLRMQGMSGLDLQEEVARRRWTLPVVLISGFVSVRHTVQALKGGATDVLRKPYSDQDLWDAIQAAFRRHAKLREERAERDALRAKFSRLTIEERQVLDLIAAGLPNKAVARRLDVGIRTVEDRRRRVMDKLGADSFAVLMTLFAKFQSLEESSGESLA